MASSDKDKELEAQLLESGNKLVEPPSSVDELLPLLDRVESCLLKVDQSPVDSMQSALSPSLKALVEDKLLRHSDDDVRVAVASCISEITRITAPEAPYDDDQMKEVFQLIVSSFEGLHDNTSRSYAKRASILETVSKVRSCVVMLDLECDSLILEMFQHFLKAIRDHHPENVFSSMETVMSLVLEESEEISVELLKPVLASVKKDDEEVLPISRRLAEKVLKNSGPKVKPYLVQAIKTLNTEIADYSKVVASICEDADGGGEQNEAQGSDENKAGESNTIKPSLDNEAEEDKEAVMEEATGKEATAEATEEATKEATEEAAKEKEHPSIDGHSQTPVSNGITLTDPSSPKDEVDHPVEDSKDLDESSKTEIDSSNPEKAISKEEMSKNSTDETIEEDTSLVKTTDDEKVEAELPDQGQEGHSDNSPVSPSKDPSADVAVPLESEKGPDDKPEEMEIESANEVPDEKTEPQEKESSDKEAAPTSIEDIPKKIADVTSDSEARPSRRKRVPAASSTDSKAATKIEESTKGIDAKSDSEEKPLKQSAKKVDRGSKTQGSSAKHAEDKKKPAKKDGKKASFKEITKDVIASPKSSGKSSKDETKSEETPKSTGAKRKRTPGKTKESSDFGHSMVGSKIKVWWPDDKAYYDGVIEAFDSARKKHKVLYTDGDVETLDLRHERWEFIGGGSVSDEDEETGQSSPTASAEMPLKKVAKTKAVLRTKLQKIDASPKSKSKVTTPKSARTGKSDGKSKDDSSKSAGKSKDDSTKSAGKSEDAGAGKSKDQTLKSGSSKSPTLVILKTSSKTKSSDSQTPKASKSKDEQITPSTKSKQVTPKTVKSKSTTPKTVSASKDKPVPASGKSSANGIGKSKSKAKESEVAKEESSDSEKLQEMTKGKKRRRSTKG